MLGGTSGEQDLHEENATLFMNITCTNGSVIRFTQLTVVLTGSGTEWEWPERRIDRVLM